MAKDNSRSKKSRIKELFKNCIVGEAPAPQEGELQSAVPGGAAPTSPGVWNQLPPRLPGVQDARPKTARTHTCAHTHSLTRAHRHSLPPFPSQAPGTGRGSSPHGAEGQSLGLH